MSNNKCKCTFCKSYRFYKWAVVMECMCGCHIADGISGHSGLCCEFPNALKINNPHKKLMKATAYKKRMNKYLGEDL